MMKRIDGGRFRLRKNKKGFTFVECVVAIALFAIIGTLAFSMFNNSARYMSKAKKEEQKLAQAQTSAQTETFKDTSGRYFIYAKNQLREEEIITKPHMDSIKSYYIVMSYGTDYGKVDVSIAIKLAPDKNGDQPGQNKQIGKYLRYSVLADVGTPRYLYIYETDNYNEGEEMQRVLPEDVYADRQN